MAPRTKDKSTYVCTKCGAHQLKWAGQCPSCGEWNCLEERQASPVAKGAAARQGYAGAQSSQLQTLDQVDSSQVARFSTSLSEFDRVLGGGMVQDGVVLLGGNPGAGKSTLLLQVACAVAQENTVIYSTGEESLPQIKARAGRLKLPTDRMMAIAETDVTSIGRMMEQHRPALLIIDSIQTAFHPELESEPGGTSQLKTCAAYITSRAKKLGIAVVFVGHVTKSDKLAGPQVLEHIVDASLMLSSTEDSRFRILRTTKNRHGDTREIGIFSMTGLGMKVVQNPSAVFLSRAIEASSGSVVTPLWEGSRPVLVEVQALLCEGATARPVCVGIDDKRVAMLMAVLQKHGGVQVAGQAIYMNIVGGVRVSEPSADLSLIIAATSSLREKVIPTDTIVIGEVGLSGEVRPVQNGQDRLLEAAKLGFKRAIVPPGNVHKGGIPGLEIIPVVNVSQAIEWVAAL